MTVGEMCTREVFIVRPEEPLIDAAREMSRRHVGALVVVDQRGDVVRPVGIVTDRDIVRTQTQSNTDFTRLSVADAMTREPLALDENCAVADAIERMSARHLRRAPIINTEGDLVGIVTFDDLLPVVADELAALARLIGTQARHEAGPASQTP